MMMGFNKHLALFSALIVVVFFNVANGAAWASYHVQAPLKTKQYSTRRTSWKNEASYCLQPTTAKPLSFRSLLQHQQQISATALSLMPPTDIAENIANPTNLLLPAAASSTFGSFYGCYVVLSATQAWVQPVFTTLDIFLNFMSLAMLSRVVLSWYPSQNARGLPWSLIIFPTEGLLQIARGFIPPAFGVDITPVAWLAFFQLIHELILGPQGILTLKIKYGI